MNGSVDIGSFSYENLHSERIRALAAKVDYTYMDEWQRGRETWAKVVMDTAKGTFERFVTSPFGTPENPMSDEAFDAKFDSCARNSAHPRSQERLDEIKRAIRTLENANNIVALTSLL